MKTGHSEELMSNVVFVGANNCANKDHFLFACAHEIGHTLVLSARKSIHPVLHNLQPHDGPTFPARYGVLPLMFYTDPLNAKWLRHEEWKPANENALEYSLP